MRKCLGPCILTAVLIVLLVTVAGCEKERPAPGPTATVALPLGTIVPTFGPAESAAEVTQVTLPGAKETSSAPTPMSTPAPLVPPTSTPPPLPTVADTGGGGTRGDRYFSYEVSPGDTIAAIAERFDSTTEDLLALNPDVDPDFMDIGQELRIPGEIPAGAGGANAYVIRSGDTLYSIAQRFGVSVEALQDINNIGDADTISEGQELRIPTSAATVPASGSGQTHTIQAGETLLSIALRYGVTVASLQNANGIADPDEVNVGQVLTIP